MLITNSLSICALWRAKMMRMQIKWPLMTVALCDLMTGWTLGFFRITYFLNYELEEGFCRLIFLILIYTTYTVQLTLATLSCDRCLCVYMEMKYVIHMTRTKTVILYVIVSFVSLLLSLIKNAIDFQAFTICRYNNIIGTSHREFFIAFGYLVKIITFLSFIFLFRKLKQIVSKTAPLGMQGFRNRFFGSATKCVVIAVTFQLMYLPYGINEIIAILKPSVAEPGTPLFYFGSSCVLLNSVINPFLYGLRFQECRIELKKLLCFWNRELIEKMDVETKCMQAPYLNRERY